MAPPTIHLVNPRSNCFTTKPQYFGRALYAPLAGLLAISAITPEDEWDLFLTDENIEPIDFSRHCDLVAISAMTEYVNRGYEIADQYRAQGVKVVMGGVHPSFLPHEALEHADAVVVGEAEPVWDQILADFKDGRMAGIYRARGLLDMRNMRYPRYDLVKTERYIVRDFVQTVRGCPHGCAFCAEPQLNGRMYRFRPIPEVIEEIRRLNTRNLAVNDVDAFSKPSRALEMMKAMTPLKIKWQGGASTRVAEKEWLLEAARESGCYMLSLGFESISRDSLREAKKAFNKPERYKALVEKIHSYGMMVFGLFMFGFDSDDESIFEETAKFAIDADIDCAAFSILTPYPGTLTYYELQRQGRITSYDWSKYDQDSVLYVPRGMSAESIRDGWRYAYKEFYSWRSIARRFPRSGQRNRLMWLVMNAFFRHERTKSDFIGRVVSDDTRPPTNITDFSENYALVDESFFLEEGTADEVSTETFQFDEAGTRTR
jgi:radical SAM superfamily enzyme YgiQ (UPF0313 family)